MWVIYIIMCQCLSYERMVFLSSNSESLFSFVFTDYFSNSYIIVSFYFVSLYITSYCILTVLPCVAGKCSQTYKSSLICRFSCIQKSVSNSLKTTQSGVRCQPKIIATNCFTSISTNDLLRTYLMNRLKLPECYVVTYLQTRLQYNDALL